MFDILRKSLATGIVTTDYPAAPAQVSSQSRGRPEIDYPNWKDARPAVAACPTGALASADAGGTRKVTLDLEAALGRAAPKPEISLPVAAFYEACAPLVEQTIQAMAPLMSRAEREADGPDMSEIAGAGTAGGMATFFG